MKTKLSLLFYTLSFCWSTSQVNAKWLPFLKQSTSDNKPLLEFKKDNSKKTIRTMSFEELKAQKTIRLVEGNKEMVIKYLEKMVPLCDDLEELSTILLELADLLFDCGKLKKAETHYREFCTLYPGDKKIEYALYKAILCSFYVLLDPDRDQSKTYQTIELTDSFLSRQEIFTTYTQEVKKIRTACFDRLVESELSIVKDYMNRKKCAQAQQRIDYLKTELLKELPRLEEHLLAVQNDLLLYQGQEPITLASFLPQEENPKESVLTQEFFESSKEEEPKSVLFVDRF